VHDSARAPSREHTRRTLGRICRALESRYGSPRPRSRGDIIAGLVGTVLSQNTTDVNSSSAYASLRERFPDWEDVERADVRSIESAIRRGGLAHVKARSIKNLLRSIRKSQGALDLRSLRKMETDEVMRYLTGMKGVGVKTAACVALFDLGREVMPVDTHVHRVIGRTGLVGAPRTRDATYRALRGIVQRGCALSLHLNLVRLGRELCRPRNPVCDACPIVGFCAHGRARTGLS
jgi:endonuclease III